MTQQRFHVAIPRDCRSSEASLLSCVGIPQTNKLSCGQEAELVDVEPAVRIFEMKERDLRELWMLEDRIAERMIEMPQHDHE